jgi:RNA-binding protein
MKLKPKQRQYLKGLGHSLKSVIQVGKDGLSEAVLSSISKALDDHELIKINILETADLDRKIAPQLIASSINAEVVQILGRKILLFRRNKEKPKIQLPDTSELKNSGK